MASVVFVNNHTRKLFLFLISFSCVFIMPMTECFKTISEQIHRDTFVYVIELVNIEDLKIQKGTVYFPFKKLKYC
jgi:hypothetical protein